MANLSVSVQGRGRRFSLVSLMGRRSLSVTTILPVLPFKVQLDSQSARRTRKTNLARNQKGCDNSETTARKLSARRIQI